MRSGACYVWARVGLDTNSKLHGEPLEGETTGTVQASSNDQSYVELALGFRACLHPAFSLDAVVTGVGIADQERASVDLGSVLLSGVFHLR